MFLWILLNLCALNLLLVRSHQGEIIMIVKRLIQGRNNMTRVRVEPRLFDHGCHKKRRLYPLGHTADWMKYSRRSVNCANNLLVKE